MRLLATLLLLFTTQIALSQTYSVTGNVVSENKKPVPSAIITVFQKDSIKHTTTTNKEGAFLISLISPGKYYLNVTVPGYDLYADTITISEAPLGVGVITLRTAVHMLDEVKIVEKIMAMVQKDDTLEFNSGAFKVNPDADAADLVRKMPSIEINDKQITAQGETVVKILVDGKPFFGTDPWATLKNLPADIIDKVQVYNEKSDQEQFTGFKEGPTSKTINIITRPDKRNGRFGKVYAGGGGDPNTITGGANGDLRYGSGLTLNQFAGDKRITLTGQSNNVNAQNFTDAAASTGGGGTGISSTNAAGINYTDKWGKKADVSGSYFFNSTSNSVASLLRKNYITSADSGQVYNQTSSSGSRNQSHRFNLRLNYKFDSMNSILFTPSISYNSNSSNSLQEGYTLLGADPVNSTLNNNNNTGNGLSFNGNLLYRHRFVKKGRTFSVSLNSGGGNNNSTGQRKDTTTYSQGSLTSDTLNQRSIQKTNNMNLTGNITYTEPIGAKGQLKVDYNAAYQPSQSDRNQYDFDPGLGAYSRLNELYSNSFSSHNLAHTAGSSYMLHLKAADFSVGLNYQLTQLTSDQTLPVKFNLGQNFQNWLPVATFHYKLSQSRNLQCNYNTNTQAPSVSQLQHVINNTDPLHLTTGNPDLKQPYRHNLMLRYNSTSKEAKSSFSASVTGSVTQHSITSSSVIAQTDSNLTPANIPAIILHKGSQLSAPVNLEGSASLSTNLSYGIPLTFMKSRLNLSLNGGLAHIPGMVNGVINYQDNKTGGIGINVNSNISEYIDFTCSSNTSLVANNNSLNTAIKTNYINENARASINLQSKSGFVFNTTLSYNTNSGLTASYNQNYLLCNLSLGKKVFKKHAGDIRLTVFDLFNQNNNIQHTITDMYIQDTRSNILQRYFLLMFSYKINNFSGPEIGEMGKG